MKRVTAIVLNYNSAQDSEKCIKYLRKQNYDNLSIVLVDNASTNSNEDEILKQIAKKFKVRYIKSQKNNGFSAGNNIGLRYALSEENGYSDWCLIINPDVELRDNGFISKVMDECIKWDKAVVVGTEIYLPSGVQQNPLVEKNFFEEMFGLLIRLKNKLIKKNYTIKKMPTGYCDKLIGCCFFIKSTFLNEINFLDENVFLYCEESIIASQVKSKNYKELFVSNVSANHEHYEKRKKGKRGKKMQIMINSRIYWLKKYSNYNKILKYLIIFSKRIESFFWKFFS